MAALGNVGVINNSILVLNRETQTNGAFRTAGAEVE